MWYSAPTSPKRESFSVLNVIKEAEGSKTNVTITYQFDANLPLEATVAITPVVTTLQDLPIYVFYDTNYPTVGTDWNTIAMLEGHLKVALYLRGYSAEVRFTSAEELEDILLNNRSGIVIIASGAFPSNVFSKEINLVKPWIDAGGILMWFGFYIGYYVVEKGMKKEDVTDNIPQHFRQDGPKQLGLDGFFEYLDIEDQPKVAAYSSPASEALDITYNLIQQSPFLYMVLENDGLVLGKIGGENSLKFRPSVSMIPKGKGKIMLFGFFLMQTLASNGPELVAWDIAQILCSGILQMNAVLQQSYPWFQSYHLLRGETRTDVSTLMVDPEVAGLAVFEYTSRKSDCVLFHREFINMTTQADVH